MILILYFYHGISGNDLTIAILFKLSGYSNLSYSLLLPSNNLQPSDTNVCFVQVHSSNDFLPKSLCPDQLVQRVPVLNTSFEANKERDKCISVVMCVTKLSV